MIIERAKLFFHSMRDYTTKIHENFAIYTLVIAHSGKIYKCNYVFFNAFHVNFQIIKFKKVHFYFHSSLRYNLCKIFRKWTNQF